MKIITSIYVAIILVELSCGYVAEYPTMMEDVVGEYTLTSLKQLFINKTASLTSAMSSITQKLAEISRTAIKASQLDAIEAKLAKSVEESTKNVQTQTTSSHLTILESIKGIPQAIVDKTKDFYALLTQAASFTLATDCFDLYRLGFNSSGSYLLQKFRMTVLCDMETDGGGWLVIQKRGKFKEQVNFDQNWSKYKIGFGNINTEFWIGNDILHIITNQKQYELLIEMVDFEKGPFYAKYSSIRVGNEASFYSLDVGTYTGNSTDAFSYHHGRTFTTTDRDGDSYTSGNCADYFSGGWWYDKCYEAHLNGIYPTVPDRHNASFITWWSSRATSTKDPLVLTEVILKIRPFLEE